MITFIEDRCRNYQHRTFINADQSQATLAFAIDYTTAGEKCTMNACRNCERPMFMFVINAQGKLGAKENSEIIEKCKSSLLENNITSINIAGNGIYTFKKFEVTQDRLNDLVTNLLKYLIDSGCKLEKVRSGGQTGADEAGLVAGDRLGLETLCLCPRGWRFRDEYNNDIQSESMFKSRFGL